MFVTVSTTPTLLELQRHVTPQYVVDWREIGLELGLIDAKLKSTTHVMSSSVVTECSQSG